MDFTQLKGKILKEITISSDKDEVIFTLTDNTKYKMYHYQRCCEGVYIEDICGDMEDLIGYPLLVAEESSNSDDKPLNDYEESYTWTYYKLDTTKGGVTIRWYGSSNGYYSESVYFEQVKE